MAHYYIAVECEPHIAKALNSAMVERGAESVSNTEWIMEAESHESVEIYNGVAAIVGQASVMIKELKKEPTWDDGILSQDLLFDLLRSS